MNNEKDLKLKLKIMRFLWYNGFFTRKNIDVLKYEFGERTNQQYTDIDTFGIRFQENFTNYKINCDCKSGKINTKDRIFWVSGLMNYINSDKSILLVKNFSEKRFRELSKSLNIIPLSEKRLSELEKIYKIDEMPLCGPFDFKNVKLEEKIFNMLKKDLKDIFVYLKSTYWYQKPNKQITALIACLNDIEKVKFRDEKHKLFLIVYIFSLLSVSLLKFSETLIIISDNEKREYIRENIVGGDVESAMIKNMYSGFHDFMKEEIKKKYNINYLVPKNEFIERLYPNYMNYLVDLLIRISINPHTAVSLPRFMDILAYEYILKNEKNNIENKLFSYNHSHNIEKVCKLSKDVILFAKRSKIISEETFKSLNDMIDYNNP